MGRTIALLFALTSCISTEVVGFVEPIVVTDTTTKKPHKPLPPRDTTEVSDTARAEIGFDPSVEDWNEENAYM